MKKVLITALLSMFLATFGQTYSTTSQRPLPQQDKKLNIALTVAEVEVVLNALQSLPYKDAAGVINSIYSQAQKQLQDSTKKK